MVREATGTYPSQQEMKSGHLGTDFCWFHPSLAFFGSNLLIHSNSHPFHPLLCVIYLTTTFFSLVFSLLPS